MTETARQQPRHPRRVTITGHATTEQPADETDRAEHRPGQPRQQPPQTEKGREA